MYEEIEAEAQNLPYIGPKRRWQDFFRFFVHTLVFAGSLFIPLYYLSTLPLWGTVLLSVSLGSVVSHYLLESSWFFLATVKPSTFIRLERLFVLIPFIVGIAVPLMLLYFTQPSFSTLITCASISIVLLGLIPVIHKLVLRMLPFHFDDLITQMLCRERNHPDIINSLLAHYGEDLCVETRDKNLRLDTIEQRLHYAQDNDTLFKFIFGKLTFTEQLKILFSHLNSDSFERWSNQATTAAWELVEPQLARRRLNPQRLKRLIEDIIKEQNFNFHPRVSFLAPPRDPYALYIQQITSFIMPVGIIAADEIASYSRQLLLANFFSHPLLRGYDHLTVIKKIADNLPAAVVWEVTQKNLPSSSALTFDIAMWLLEKDPCLIDDVLLAMLPTPQSKGELVDHAILNGYVAGITVLYRKMPDLVLNRLGADVKDQPLAWFKDEMQHQLEHVGLEEKQLGKNINRLMHVFVLSEKAKKTRPQ